MSTSRQDRVNIIPTTRTSTGKLPLPRQLDLPDSSSNRIFSQKISSGDVKEKMEQQLRAQREANNKKRAEEMKQGEFGLWGFCGRFDQWWGLLGMPLNPLDPL
jgi:hypothetical protein